MPTQLPSGLVLYNSTPHDLCFWCKVGDEMKVVTAPSDFIINAKAVSKKVYTTGQYNLSTLTFMPIEEGWAKIRHVREVAPKAIIVGSTIAAQTYREEVFAPVEYKWPKYRNGSYQKLLIPYQFTIFKKEEITHVAQENL